MEIINNKCKRYVIISIGLMIVVLFMSWSTVLADTAIDETKTIDMNGTYAIPLNNIKAEDVLSIEVQVTEGSSIDILLVNANNYNSYLSGGMVDVVNDRIEGKVYSPNVMSQNYNLNFDKPGDYYLILDNTNKYGQAKPVGTVNAHVIITGDIENQTDEPIQTSTLVQTATPISTASPVADSTSESPGFGTFAIVLSMCLIVILKKR
jgi:hypothetical protein